jgi:DNA-binding transcriptional LysR family regulator
LRHDINLFVVFSAVAETKSVTLAAEKLALSQSAVSHALNRLRDLVGDPLFTRNKSGLVLTPRAQSMVEPVRAMLETADNIVTQQGFDAQTSQRRFRIGASDYAASTIVPEFIKQVRQLAPNITLEFAPETISTFKKLQDGQLDISFWAGALIPEAYQRERLFKETFVGIICRNHPLAQSKSKRKISIEQYLTYPHIAVTLRELSKNIIDPSLLKLGFQRKVVVLNHGFNVSIMCLRGSDLIATVPSRIIKNMNMNDFVSFELPFELPSFDYSLCWHRRVDGDSGINWLREQLKARAI